MKRAGTPHPLAAGVAVIALLATMLTVAVAGFAPPPAAADVGGTLEASYGSGDGIVERRARFRPSELSTVAVDSTGRVLTATTGGPDDASRTYISRYLADGTLDATFGQNGVTTLPAGPEVSRIIVRSDGTIVLGGTIDDSPKDNFYAARLTSSGGFDDSFAGDGVISIEAGTMEDCNEFGCSDLPVAPVFGDVALRGDGLIIAGAAELEYDCTFGCSYAYDVRMWQVNDAGTIDPGFVGQVTLSQVGADDGCVDIAVDAQERIYCHVLGEMTVVRLFAGGSVDSSFSGDGVATAAFSGVESGRGMVLDSGKPVLVGEGNLLSATTDDVVIARFTTGGTLDSSFDGDGRRRLSLVGGDDYVRSVRNDSSGRLLVAASKVTDGGLIARFTASGALDNTFAGNGKASVAGSVIVDDMARNGNKIVAAGRNSEFNATLSRLTSTGSLDTAFGGDGHAPTDVFAPDSSYEAMALLPDGKTVAVGGAEFPEDDVYVVTRHDASGAADSAFPESMGTLSYGGLANDIAVDGSDLGVTIEDLDPFDNDLLLFRWRDDELDASINIGNGTLHAVAADDGQFVVAGTIDGPEGNDIVVARVDSGAQLTLDSTFGDGGVVHTSVSTGTDRPRAIAVQPDGKIVVAGSSWVSGKPRVIVLRYTEDGDLDTTFSDDGWIRLNFTGDDDGTALALTPDGSIVVAGTGSTTTEDRMLVAKLTPAGELDPEFGNGGKRNFRLGTARGSAVNGVAVDADGRVVLAGAADAGAGSEVALVRLDADGTDDIGLTGTTNFVLTSIGAGDDAGNDIVVEPSGRVLIAGAGATDTGSEAVIVAYTGTTTNVFVHTAGQAFEGDAGTAFHTMFLIGIDAVSSGPVTVHWTTANGTATAGSDYVAVSGDATFLPGQTLHGVSLQINGDLGAENHETVKLVLSAPTNARLGVATGFATITDDDSTARPPTVSISGPNATDESTGAAGVTFTVSLTSASSLPVQVDAVTINGTAIAPGDYAPTLANLAFSPGTTQQTVVVPITNDGLDEANETFSMTLANPQYTVIGTGIITTRIDDDDAAPTVTVHDATVAEGNAGQNSLTFVVTLSSPSGKVIKVDFATGDVTATAGSDYTAKTGTVTIPALAAGAQFVVKVTGDLTVETDETLSVTLSNPNSATIADGNGVGTITNDDN